MSTFATQDRSTTTQTSTTSTSWSAPAWAPAQPATTGQTGLTAEQAELDAQVAAEAGMGAAEVAALGAFGMRPSEFDTEAARRVAIGLKRMEALLACEDGNEVGCELAGPGLVGHQKDESVSGETSDELVVEDAEFTLRLTTRTNADGQVERSLLYSDVDGSFHSGISKEPIEAIPTKKAQEQAPAPAPEGIGSFLEGALLGDFADNDTWSAMAGQTVVGLIPVVGQIADARDTAAAVVDVIEGKDGAWPRLGAAGVGWIPVIGDVLKGLLRSGAKLGTKVVEEGIERAIKEGAEEGGERLVKEGAEEGTEEGAEQLARGGADEAGDATQKSEGGEKLAKEAAEEGGEKVVKEEAEAADGLATSTPSDRWDREPRGLQDQMALDAARKGAGEKIMENLGDPRYEGMEKWEYKFKSANGRDTVVHYVYDPVTGQRMDFKFKKQSDDFLYPPRS